jgi:hypothetical protein
VDRQGSRQLQTLPRRGVTGIAKIRRFTGSPGSQEEISMATIAKSHYENFTAFYPVYLNEHSNRVCRQLHFAGSTLALLSLVLLAVTGNPWWLLAGIVCGYGFAWTGHFAFEKNQPATFQHPFYSFMGDWVMYWQMLTGQISF